MKKIPALIISLYVATFVYLSVSFVSSFTVLEDGGQLFWNRLAILLIILLPVNLAISKFVSPPYTRGIRKSIRALIQGVALIGLTLAIFYNVLDIQAIFDLPSQVDMIFASDLAFDIWLILPILTLFI